MIDHVKEYVSQIQSGTVYYVSCKRNKEAYFLTSLALSKHLFGILFSNIKIHSEIRI